MSAANGALPLALLPTSSTGILLKIRKLDISQQQISWRHNNVVVHQRFYDSAENSSDNDTHRHIDGATSHGEFSELSIVGISSILNSFSVDAILKSLSRLSQVEYACHNAF